MKFAILGTRGIPNHYGGFEQFAENLSKQMALMGHEVIVYNPSYHPFKEKSINNVSIVTKYCPENILKGAAHFIYDYYCLKDAVKREVDVALMCGYGTSAPALSLVKKGKTKVIINMDGFEWKRAKYNVFTKLFLKWFEKLAIKYSDKIVADHPVIQKYFHDKNNISPVYIPYGAVIPSAFNENILSKYNLEKDNYFLIIARDEPENQIEVIISSWNRSGTSSKLCIVTNRPRLSRKYSHFKNIKFIKDLYDYSELSSLRHFSLACIHGHTVGGTNPSLLEAMAAQSFIIAHDNIFHRSILFENALFFNDDSSLIQLFQGLNNFISQKDTFINGNLENIQKNYRWKSVAETYVKIL